MKLIKEILICFILILSLASFAKCDAVCDLKTLILEIKQDLADNGMLDCLRVIEPPHFVEETEDQKNLRLAAQWDTACSFEADTNWMDMLKSNFGITQLVDSIGEPVSKDFDDQADMCEIIRAAVYKNVFDVQDLNMQSIPDCITDKISCAGVDKDSPNICAATGTSYFQKDSWSIFLIPSYITFAGKPKFIKTREENKKERYPPLSKRRSCVADIAKGIKAGESPSELIRDINKNVSNDQEDDHQKENSHIVHVHVKRTTTSKIGNNGSFSQLEGGQLNYNLDSSRLIFSFYMISFSLKKQGNFSAKMTLNGREIAETRQNLGRITEGSLTSAFAEVFQPGGESGNSVNLNVLYDSSSEGFINSEAKEHNLSYGSITMPKGSVFKHINSNNLTFKKSDNWVDLTGFEITINNDSKGEKNYMILYNLALKLANAATLSSRLKLGENTYKETTTSTGPAEVLGNHAGYAVKINPGKTIAKITYKFDGDDDLTISDFTDPHFVQSIVAFELPEATSITNYMLDQQINLNSGGTYKVFGLKANVNLEKKKTILINYNVNLKVEKGFLSVRLKMGDRFNKKSILSIKDLTYGRASGYVVRVLQQGNYTFDLEYKSDSEANFIPETADAQVVSMQIIEMD